MKLAAATLMLIAAGGPVAADGYRFEHAEFARSSLELTVVMHPTLRDLRDSAWAAGVRNRPAAWAQFEAEQPHCTIHIVDPAENYRPELIGHELTHCIYGRWHS